MHLVKTGVALHSNNSQTSITMDRLEFDELEIQLQRNGLPLKSYQQ